jgi:phosphopantothenoylcysteine decarboxylase/phosphopantothenate--cysteine ligase
METRKGSRRNKGSLLEGKKVLLIITGGIAAYKSAYLLRQIKGCGADVRVLMTDAARQFVAPLTFEVLSENPVPENLFSGWSSGMGGVKHIKLVQWSDAVVVAPATADFIARVACGLGDDLPATVMIGVRCPVLFAPAMNENMWESTIVQKNITTLRSFGYKFVTPEEGELACGDSGTGRMAEPENIVESLKSMLSTAELEGVRVVVTAGRTEEDIDPVRYISNRSSGRMGFAMCEEAVKRGAEVTLICGRTDVDRPDVDSVIEVKSASDMKEAVIAGLGETDILIMTAAISDYRPVEKSLEKIRRGGQKLNLALEPTEDILKLLGNKKNKGQIIVGFALETKDPERNVMAKIREKRCDYMVLNEAGEETGFDVDTNKITLFRGEEKLESTPLISKREAASVIFDHLVRDSRVTELTSNYEDGKEQGE